MPSEVTRFVCNVCSSEYETLSEAWECECLFKEPPDFTIGSEISYTSESQLSGEMYQYNNCVGTIKAIAYIRHENRHIPMYLVQTKQGYDGICKSDSESEYVSLEHWKFGPDFIISIDSLSQ